MISINNSIIDYTKDAIDQINSFNPKNKRKLLEKNSNRVFSALEEAYQKSNHPDATGDDIEKYESILGAGLALMSQYKKDGDTVFYDVMKEFLQDNSIMDEVEIDELMHYLDDPETDWDKVMNELTYGPYHNEMQQPSDDLETEPQEPIHENATRTDQKTDYSLEELRCFDYIRARKHFESRNPISQFFSKLAGKIFGAGEYHVLSVKAEGLMKDYNSSQEGLDMLYNSWNNHGKLDKVATDDVDYSIMSATDEELDEFLKGVNSRVIENAPQNTSEVAVDKSKTIQKEIDIGS